MATFIGAPKSPRHGVYEIDIDGVKHRLPRVSTILGVISKPGLEAWRQRIGVEDANRISNEAAEHGTLLHKILEDIDRGDDSYLVPDHLKACVRVYREWRIAEVASVLMVEQIVYHERHKYAGTLDRLYLLRDGRRVIADFKTGGSVDGAYRLQQMAYQEAVEDMGQGPVDGRLILHLPRARPGQLTVIDYDDEDRDRRAWRACLRLWRWNERHKRDWQTTRVKS